ncbi:SPOR domain-containing protein [Gilvimarinus sp. 1_MG-2023]|uniref:SPOR domain-containing protein n=1 Tax=Gilvimarinus sp. 1_MG-2023 TaxID=3062638 RepID=UPI0026E160B2|nr:AAA family ATPase [Gilvimarinus sp. 1_MG-2023]MDO6746332.1 AAA family ATPase [Gilvimarinus sp. 1_MG-2023]
MSIADYMETLGLQRDPFQLDNGLPWQGLTELAANVIHELEFVCPLVWVVGHKGAGKTTLAHLLGQQLQASGEVLLFNASEGDNLAQITRQIGELLLLPDDESADLLSSIEQVVNNEPVAPIAVVVDNADLIPPSRLNQWLSQFQQAGLLACRKLKVILLTSEDPQQLALNRAVPVHSYAIPEPSLNAALTWLNQLMLNAGAVDPVFDGKTVTPWWREAEGNFNKLLERAKIHLLAQESSVTVARAAPVETVLQLNAFDHGGQNGEPGVSVGRDPALEAGADRQSSLPGRSLPVVHIVTVAALLAGLIVVYLYSPGGKVAPESTAVKLSIPATVEQPRETLAPATLQTTPLVEAPQSSNSASEIPKTASVDDKTKGLREQTQTARSEPRMVAGGEVISASVAGKKLTSSHSRAYSSIRPVIPDYSADELEIMSWPAEYYTLQVLGVSQKQSAQRFIAEQSNAKSLRLYQTVRKSKPWFVVVVGVYATRGEAEAAKTTLPGLQRRAQPWLRRVHNIQQEIE